MNDTAPKVGADEGSIASFRYVLLVPILGRMLALATGAWVTSGPAVGASPAWKPDKEES
jgi:hypothetical protein